MNKIFNFFKMPLIAVVLIITAGGTTYRLIEAQEAKQIPVSNVLVLSSRPLTQDPKTKEFKILLAISSTLDSDRVKVTWNVPKYIQINTQQTSFVEVKAGTPTIVQAGFNPQVGGDYEIEAVVEVMKADVNYVSSATHKISLNSDREIVPHTGEFQNYQRTYSARDSFKILAIILTAAGVLVVSITTFFRWLNAEDSVKSKI